MKILGECKRVLSYGGLGIGKSINIGGMHIPRFVPRTVISSALLLLGTSAIVNSIKNFGDGLEAVLYSFDCLIAMSMKLSTYLTLLWQTDQIAELIEHIRMVVNRRRFCESRIIGKVDIFFFQFSICLSFIRLQSFGSSSCHLCQTSCVRSENRLGHCDWHDLFGYIGLYSISAMLAVDT